MYSCGWNNKGQLGVNDLINRQQFTPISSDIVTKVRLAACGWNHTLIVTGTIENSDFCENTTTTKVLHYNATTTYLSNCCKMY